MIAHVVQWCTRRSWLVIAAAVVLAGAGEAARRALPRDAIPDLSSPRIAVVAEWMGHSAPEVASGVTRELTRALDGIAGSTAVRGSSMAGMAYLDVVFADGADLEAGRRAVVGRVEQARARLPRAARVQVGPLASSTGWVFQYVLVDPTRRASLLRMRRLQDTLVRPALLQIPGVAEVASVGGDVQQAVVETSADQLRARAVAFSDVAATLRPEAHGLADLKRFRFLPVENAPELPGMSQTRVGDVARFDFNADMLTGYTDFNGEVAALGAIVVARRGADPAQVIPRIRAALDGVRDKLTPGNVPHQSATIQIVTAYDRLELVTRASATLTRALAEEVAVVVLVTSMFLLHARSALIPLATLPVVLLLTFGGMWLLGVPATIMSLGGIGIALGMAVDADVVALEACHRRLEAIDPDAPPRERRRALTAAAATFAPAILTSLLITALGFLPVLAFSGETGRLLGPLAITKTIVIAAAALVALTLAPALRERLLRGGVRAELDNPLTARLIRVYRPFVRFALRRPGLTLATAVLALGSCLPLVTRMGREFLPRVDEGGLLFMPTTAPGASVGEVAEQLGRQDRALYEFDEVATVFGKVGRATTATDPAPLWMAETTIQLRPRASWPNVPRARWYSSWAPAWLKGPLGRLWPEATPRTLPELIEALDQAVHLPGWTSAWTAPMRARMDMLSTGVHTPVGVRVVAPEPARLEALGEALERITARVPGARTAVFESLRDEPWPRFELDPAALERHDVDPAAAREVIDLVLGGGELGTLAWQGDNFRFRLTPGVHTHPGRRTADVLRDVTVRSRGTHGGAGEPVALALLGRPSLAAEPAMLRSERGELVAYVHVDLAEGVDPASYVAGARAALEQAQAAGEVTLRAGERVEWTGQYELLASGERRLAWIVPLVLLLMLGLLYLQFRSAAEALIVLLSVPFALVGSFWTLHLLGYPLSAPVWVGLLSTVGLATQTGVVMVVYIDDVFHRCVREGRIRDREDIVRAHAEGTVQRLRPKIMTVTTMAAGLLPLMWIEGGGAEIMRRVAAPMLGGLITSAFLTLEVIPVVYTLWRHHQLRVATRTGRPLAEVVGRVPRWVTAAATTTTTAGYSSTTSMRATSSSSSLSPLKPDATA